MAMKAVFLLQFDSSMDKRIISRTLDCIEEINRQLQKPAIGTIQEADSYRDGSFVVQASNRRFIGDIRNIIEKTLTANNLRANCHIQSAATICSS